MHFKKRKNKYNESYPHTKPQNVIHMELYTFYSIFVDNSMYFAFYQRKSKKKALYKANYSSTIST